ncbi:Cysteine-rich receptor-like protein kinase 41 [Carex littledalei]|uniref:Cysteine-rich receptor-like protein kinase 41 n=1 Tax=Carex littledalei TaxID=544730 RepID=A0A833UXU1_9POAL|nr:Cysteine-rich receptor-like protein kinase 41 [Carex littledalei]
MVKVDGALLSPSPISPSGVNDGNKKSTVIILAIVISLVVTILSISTFCICLYKKRLHRRKELLSEIINSEQNKENIDSFIIGLSTLKAATINFDESNKLGEGGFGAVYKTWEQWTAGTITNIIDPFMDCPTNEIIQYIHIGLLCVQEDLKYRPRMSEVVIMLGSNTVSLQVPSKPAFYLRRGGGVSSDGSQKNLVPVSQNELTISELEPR